MIFSDCLRNIDSVVDFGERILKMKLAEYYKNKGR